MDEEDMNLDDVELSEEDLADLEGLTGEELDAATKKKKKEVIDKKSRSEITALQKELKTLKASVKTAQKTTYCSSCMKLKKEDTDFWTNGTNCTVCTSLSKNEGLNKDTTKETNPVTNKNCEAMHDVNNCLNEQAKSALKKVNWCSPKSFMDFLKFYVCGLHEVLNAMICAICGMWNSLKKDILNLYKIVNAMQGMSYTILKEGTDYTLTYRNDWEDGKVMTKGNGAPEISVTELVGMTIVRFHSHAKHYCCCKDVTKIKFSHGESDIAVPESIVCHINFLGNYKYLNTGAASNSQQSGDSVLNVAPKSSRASWSCYENLTKGAKKGSGLMLQLESITDGWNDQYSTRYPSAKEISSSNIDVRVYVKSNKTAEDEYKDPDPCEYL